MGFFQEDLRENWTLLLFLKRIKLQVVERYFLFQAKVKAQNNSKMIKLTSIDAKPPLKILKRTYIHFK